MINKEIVGLVCGGPLNCLFSTGSMICSSIMYSPSTSNVTMELPLETNYQHNDFGADNQYSGDDGNHRGLPRGETGKCHQERTQCPLSDSQSCRHKEYHKAERPS